jgi:LytR cell envelope-related transcriptional attenuator
MVLLAFSPQHEVEKYGAYVAIACFFGLAILSLLYFAQARELRRLREWAGVQPERPDELQDRVAQLSESVRRVSQQQVAVARAAQQRQAVPAGNGVTQHKLKPEQVAALAFARAAGVPSPPHPPQVAPVPVALSAGAEPVVSPPPTPTPGPATVIDDEPVTAGNGNGHGTGEVPPPVTPAGRAAPLRQTPPPARRPAPSAAPPRRIPTGPPARRETSMRSVVLTVVLGLVAIALVAFLALQVIGGGSDKGPTAKTANPTVTPGAGTSSGGGGSSTKSGSKKPKATPTPTRTAISVEVYNGTTKGGLAATLGDNLVDAGYARGNVRADNDPAGNGRTASAVLYKSGAAAKGKDVAKVLDIKTVKQMDPATEQSVSKDVIVEVGADKSGT